MKVGGIDDIKFFEAIRNDKNTICGFKFIAMYYNPGSHMEEFYGIVVDVDDVVSVNERVMVQVDTNKIPNENLIPKKVYPEKSHSTQGSYVRCGNGLTYSTYASIVKVGELFEEVIKQRRQH